MYYFKMILLLSCWGFTAHAQTSTEEFRQIEQKANYIIQQVPRLQSLEKLLWLERKELADLKSYYQAYHPKLSEREKPQAQNFLAETDSVFSDRKKLLELGLPNPTQFKNEIIEEVQRLDQKIKNTKDLSTCKTLEYDYASLKNRFSIYTKDARSILGAGWVDSVQHILETQESMLSKRCNTLAHQIPVWSNRCKTMGWTWNIAAYHRVVSRREQKLNKSIEKLASKIAKTPAESKKLTKLEQKYQQKHRELEALIERQEQAEHLLDQETLLFSLVCCKKHILYQDQAVTYWGIKEVILPQDRKSATFQIKCSYEIQDSIFQDQLHIQLSIKQGKLLVFNPVETTISWQLTIKDPIAAERPQFQLSPMDNQLLFKALNQENAAAAIHYSSNMAEQNQVILQELNMELKD